MLQCSIDTNLDGFRKVMQDLCNNFEKSHEKTQEHDNVLAPIVGKGQGQKIILGILLGVLECLISRGLFRFSV